MILYECDQIGTDILDAAVATSRKHGAEIKLDYHRVLGIMAEIGRRHRSKDFEETLDRVLDLEHIDQPFTNDAERDGYKIALGKIYGRRSAWKQAENRAHGRYAPFAPR